MNESVKHVSGIRNNQEWWYEMRKSFIKPKLYFLDGLIACIHDYNFFKMVEKWKYDHVIIFYGKTIVFFVPYLYFIMTSSLKIKFISTLMQAGGFMRSSVTAFSYSLIGVNAALEVEWIRDYLQPITPWYNTHFSHLRSFKSPMLVYK